MNICAVDNVGSNRNLVLCEVMRQPGISRSAIAARLSLNLASVSRISRELIEAQLIREEEVKIGKKGPGRRFIGLAPNGSGGYIVGIGLNAFRQSVTLADIENKKIAEWVSDEPPSHDGVSFINLCLGKAADMVRTHVPDRHRFFGVGVAVAANLDLQNGIIIDAPAFGWTDPIPLRSMVTQRLDAPLSLSTPSTAINQSETESGKGQGFKQVITLHCNLGFGLGARKTGDLGGGVVDFGRVLVHARSADTANQRLDALCGGVSVLNQVYGPAQVDAWSDIERGRKLSDLIQKSDDDDALQEILCGKGSATALHMSLLIDVLGPDLILLAGPLAQSSSYVEGFHSQLEKTLTHTGILPDVRVSKMTPTGASRWLALRGNVGMGNLDLSRLKTRSAA